MSNLLNKNEIEIMEKLKIPKIIKDMEHPGFSIKFDKGDLIFEIPDDDVRYSMYSDDILGYYYKEKKEYKALELMYGEDRALRTIQNNANHFASRAKDIIEKLKEEEDSTISSDDQNDFICYILNSYLSYILNNIKNIDELEKPLRLPLFTYVYNKLRPNKKVAVKDSENNTYAGTLKSINYSRSFFGESLSLCLEIISFNGNVFLKHNIYVKVPVIEEILELNDLVNVEELTEDSIQKYTERGKKYLKYVDTTYSYYDGFAYTFGFFSNDRTNINGRVMIDITNFREMNPSLDDDWYDGIDFSEENKGISLDENNYWQCSPVVYGFSFNNKEWCKMSIENVNDIVFASQSFNELKIKDSYKDIIIAALTNEMPSLDSIAGKGEGKIFLLYGPAGCGKTMTAESVAEYLKKPLYFVSVGELGTQPRQLEENLSQVMKIATAWDAVVLFDEVDAFVTRRDNMNLERNAMTAIFLRLLERYNGIMFMTTNLKDNLDEAFISRCTSAIEYASLTADVRANIWESILNKAKCTNKVGIEEEVYNNIPMLAKHEINGRVIKNTIRLAYSMALSKNTGIKLKYLNDIIELNSVESDKTVV
jgi:hypothetical protein